ncbi:MAG: 2'-deoxycytidine 5'-triphosphate deaminase [Nitrospirota bacterium]|nr:2'-deoxycytidine 5'-triphosphate deaminase [Nitrospirota bacterium]
MSSDMASLFPELKRDLVAFHSKGVLPAEKIKALISSGYLNAPQRLLDDQVQPASIDLRLGARAYRVRASFLPGRHSTVMRKIETLKMHEIDLSSSAVLEKGCVYIIPLMESLRLPPEISARANPKSTTGRLDIFTRLISDYGTEFERVQAGYKGDLYVEVVPRTFSVLVREGTKLNQLRFIRGLDTPHSDQKLDKLDRAETLVYMPNDEAVDATISEGLRISIDLQGVSGEKVIGYRALQHAPLIDLGQINYYDPNDFWEPIYAPKSGGLLLNPDDFYILLSKEKVRIPPDHAAEMVAYDPSVGEFRIHYAGFFDPGFGYGDNDIKGTHAVLEVRSHEVPFLLEDGQFVGRLIYEKLLGRPEKTYGVGIGSSYQNQGLSLSKQFKRF